jgi:hypothetical protein
MVAEMHDAIKAHKTDIDLGYAEPPPELFDASELDLRVWSIIMGDKSLEKLARKSKERSERDFNIQELVGDGDESLAAMSSMLGLSSKPSSGVRALNIHKADQVTDVGLKWLGECSALEELDIGNCVNVTDSGLRAVAKGCRNLTKLNMDNLLRACGPGLAAIGECCPNITDLSVANCAPMKEWVMLRVFDGMRHLQRLNFKNCFLITDAAMKQLSSYCPNIQWLNLAGCRQVTDVGLLTVCQACQGLEWLDVSATKLNYQITDLGLLGLGDHSPELMYLNLEGREKLTDVGMSWLSKGCHSLTELNINGCLKVTDTGLRALGEGCRALQVFKMSGLKEVSDVGIRHVADGFEDLRTLNASGIWLISDGVQRDFGVEGLQALANGCQKLENLNLTGCFRIKETTLKALAGGPAKNFKKLSFAGCTGMTREGFCSVVRVSTQLENLNLSLCTQVTDLFMKEVGRMCKRLKNLNLQGCDQITDKTVEYVAHGCKGLTNLNLTGCPNIGDHSMMAVADANFFPGLRSLELAGCSHVSETGISWLADRNTTLITLSLKGTKVKRPGLKAMKEAWKYGMYHEQNSWFGIMPAPRAHDRMLIQEYGECWKAAIRIQGVYRGKIAKRQMAIARERYLMDWVATRMQSVWRGRQARRYALLKKMQHNHEVHCAIVIQNQFRCKLARKRMQDRKGELWHEKINRCAILVQRNFRRRLCQRLLQMMLAAQAEHMRQANKAAAHLQARWRGKVGRENYGLMKASLAAQKKLEDKSATKMQGQFRGRMARKELAHRKERSRLRVVEEQHAATHLQAMARGKMARRMAARKRLEGGAMEKAAVKLQCRWRARNGKFAANLLRQARAEMEEDTAALKLQAAYRGKLGRLKARKLQMGQMESAEELIEAARLVQRAYRGHQGRSEFKNRQQSALALVHRKYGMETWAATRMQAGFRGMLGRKRYWAIVDAKKRKWKQMQDNDGKPFYYNSTTGEMRRRKPQDLLDLMPRPRCTCGSCAAVKETRGVFIPGEPVCDTCFKRTMFGAKEKLIRWRTLYDYYGRRVDYGDGEFPAKWPSEVEQDEWKGPLLRVEPIREPVGKDIESGWTKYHDEHTDRDFWQNAETGGETYDRPLEYSTPRNGPEETKRKAKAAIDQEWVKKYDEENRSEYYYNSKTLSTSKRRPSGYVSPRALEGSKSEGALVSFEGGKGKSNYTKQWDDTSGQEYYYNEGTGESEYERPSDYYTPRPGQAALEQGLNDWSKYYDDSSQTFYYHNLSTGVSSFDRPPAFSTPREGTQPIERGVNAWAKYFDEATGQEYFYNKDTGENTHVRPSHFSSPRPEQEISEQGVNSWAKYYDDSSEAYYYVNNSTGASTFDRPADFATPRPGQKAIEMGGNNWSKYYDDAAGDFYYYNESTGQNTFDRPYEFTTPR